MNIPAPKVKISWIPAILAGISAFILYFYTLAPDLVWQDQGDFQVWVAQCKLEQVEFNNAGERISDVVRVHPLYIVFAHWLGRLTPMSYAYAANLTSAIFAALGVSGIAALVYSLTSRVLPAIISASVCALGHTYWFMATQAQTYSMSNAFTIWGLLFAILYCLANQKRNLYIACFIFGLGVSVHNMSQIAFFVLAVFIGLKLYKGALKWREVMICLMLWLIGGSLWLYAIGLEYKATGDLLGSVLSGIYGRWGNAVFNAADIVHLAKRSILFFILNFPTPLVILAVPGILFGRRVIDNCVYNFLIASLVLYILFAFRYHVPNQNHFFMPAYILISIFIGLGYVYWRTHELSADWLVAIVLLVWIVPTYAGICFEAQNCGFSWGHNRHIPYRHEYKYYLEPWQQGQTGPRKMVEEVFHVLPKGAVLVVDSTPYSAFEYAIDIEAQRPDLVLIDLSNYNAAKYVNNEVYFLMDIDLYKKRIDVNAELIPVYLSGDEKIFKLERK